MARTVCLLALVVACPAGAAEKAAKAAAYTGKVVTLASLLEAKGVALDADAAPVGLVLQADDGKVYPLVKNDGSRMFFKDKALLGRTVRLTGRLVAGSSMLDVSAVQTLVKGKPHEAYYWCENCQLAYSEPGECLCCGAKVKLVEVEGSEVSAKLEKLIPRD